MDNINFIVFYNRNHGGALISEHTKVADAYKSAFAHKVKGCTCGCTIIRPTSIEARREMDRYVWITGLPDKNIII